MTRDEPTSAHVGKTKHKLAESLQMLHPFCFILTSHSRINGEEGERAEKNVYLKVLNGEKFGQQELVLKDREQLTCN